MTQEEKAKRYDDLLVKLQKAKTDDNVCDDRYCCVIDIIVPELKELEDERIRKALKEYFINSFQNNGVAAICGVHIKDILAWLEKQGQTFTKKDVDEAYIKGISDAKNELEKQGKQSPDKVEPRFRVGDTVRRKDDGLEAKVLDVFSNGTILVECDDWTDIVPDNKWIIVEKPKSLKDRVQPQNTWKPDKAVIQILELIIQGKANPTNYQATLMNLVEQLKKLK